jgi:hypothetical protein
VAGTEAGVEVEVGAEVGEWGDRRCGSSRLLEVTESLPLAFESPQS